MPFRLDFMDLTMAFLSPALLLAACVVFVVVFRKSPLCATLGGTGLGLLMASSAVAWMFSLGLMPDHLRSAVTSLLQWLSVVRLSALALLLVAILLIPVPEPEPGPETR